MSVPRDRGAASDIAERALRAGARSTAPTRPRCWCSDGAELTAKVRLGEPELVQEASSRALGLRVFRDQRAALTYTSDLVGRGARALRRRVGRAGASSPSPTSSTSCRRRERAGHDAARARAVTTRALAVDAKAALERCKRGEAAARALFAEGHQLRGRDLVARGRRERVRHQRRLRRRLSRQLPVARRRADLRRRRRQEAQRLLVDRPIASSRAQDPEEVGLEAARRTVAKLGSREGRHRRVPVVFDPEAGARCCARSSASSRAARSGASRATSSAARARGRVAAGHHRRRSADPRAARLAPLRRRRPGHAQERRRRGRRAQDLSPRRLLGAQARAPVERLRRARRRRRAARDDVELHPAGGHDQAGGRSSAASRAGST